MSFVTTPTPSRFQLATTVLNGNRFAAAERWEKHQARHIANSQWHGTIASRYCTEIATLAQHAAPKVTQQSGCRQT